MATQTQKKILLFLGIFLALFILNKTVSPDKGIIEQIATGITYPFILICNKITQPFQNFFENKKSYTGLLEQYKKLKEDYESSLTENVKLKASINYEKISNDILDFQERYDLKEAILAKILVKNFSEDEHCFLVNRGSKDGIEKNMVAIYKFQILGKVVDVDRWSSKILLITDKNCKVSAYTNSTYAQGIVIGKNKPNICNMVYVSYLSKINTDDFIISSGQGMIFPEGFCLGKIIKYSTKGLYHKIRVRPLIDFEYLNFCLLINQEKIKAF
jgi:rod shape-determining protein MreC